MGAPVIQAGRPTSLWLRAPEPIPENTELTLWLRGPKKYRGIIAERDAPTKTIEARFAVRVAGEYILRVQDKTKRILLSDTLHVGPGPAHTASSHLVTSAASPDGRRQLLQAVDTHGNMHREGGVQFQAAIASEHCVVADHCDGTYSISLPPAIPSGPHQLRVWQTRVSDKSAPLEVSSMRAFQRTLPSVEVWTLVILTEGHTTPCCLQRSGFCG